MKNAFWDSAYLRSKMCRLHVTFCFRSLRESWTFQEHKINYINLQE